ncbi:uncharacterized protein LOC143883065 [Tasmannia lanceolata]|uniref:uncharacterized protein LOC143883065 n=1 Tax=Tasmannia lanceolata TaxID=3420 RepID=UPI0040640F88
MVKKSNRKWRICIDFTDLNKACPKDSYPLPKIDQLIDATSGHELLSFMDAFSDYNQIRMCEEDVPTNQALYFYRVMPFGLKNARATYQRLVNQLFRKQIGRNMEVYVDDMLVKSLQADQHVIDLEEAFQVLRQNIMKLNPTKCAFGVKAGKFLGFMQRPVYYVSQILHDVELRYQKVEKIAYALVLAARKLRPYFQSHTIDVLTDQQLRQILHKPDSFGRLVKCSIELSEFDIQHKPRPAIKAQVLANFLAECIIPREPSERQKMVLEEPSANDEAPTSQGSNLERETSLIDHSDLTTEMGGLVEQLGDPEWNLFVDGSSNEQGSGAGLILTGPDGLSVDYALHFCFKASINEAEYEALIAGMRMAQEVGADNLRAHSDSQLVVNQVTGEYEAKESRMSKYLGKVKTLIRIFKRFKIIKVPQTENAKADALSRLASSGYTNLGKFWADLEIEQRFTSVAHPQTNGQTEVANRILLQGIRKRLDDHERRWANELYHVLWAYRTTTRTATGETPFNLTFGTEAVIPLEIGTPALRNEYFNEKHNPEGLRTNLDLLEEAREWAGIRMATYHQRVARYHDTKEKERLYRVGDLVLRQAEISQPTKVGELTRTEIVWDPISREGCGASRHALS